MKCLRIYAVTLAVMCSVIASADLEQGYLAYQRGDFGQMYRLGKGIEQNDQEAIKWYTLAARQGSTHAQHNLKLMARDGRISDADYRQATNTAASPGLDQETVTASTAAPSSQGKTPNTKKNAPKTSQQWLNQLNPQDYVVQLLATPQKDAVTTFLANNRANLETSPTRTTSIVRTNSKGQDWYVLLLGPFTNEQGARAAVAELPPALRDNDPWVRQVSAVRAIARK